MRRLLAIFIFLCIPISAFSQTNTNLGNVNISGYLNVAGNGAKGNAAICANASASIRFVSYAGNDSNTGCFLGQAKLSIEAAAESLPGGSTSPAENGRGTILVLSGNHGTSCPLLNSYTSPTVGLGFIYGSDPNVANPPTGWMLNNGRLSIIGISTDSDAALSTGRAKTCVTVLGTLPATMLAINGTNIDIENIILPSSTQPVSMGYDSTGASGDSGGGAAALRLDNNTFVTIPSGSNGPTVKVGSGVFQVYMDYNTLAADCNQTPLSDNGANLLINGGPEASFGFKLTNNWWYCGGGIKYYVNGTFHSISVKDLDIETDGSSPNMNPGVWYADDGGANASAGDTIENVQLQDYHGTPVPAVRNDGSGGNGIVATNVAGWEINTQGPMTMFGGNAANLKEQTVSPQQQLENGIFGGRLIGATDITARMFSPVAVRFSNLATTIAANWTNSGDTTFTTGILAPDGTTGAGQFVATSGPFWNAFLFPQTSMSIAVGGYVVAGAMTRSGTANGYSGGEGTPIQIQAGSATFNCAFPSTASGIGDGEWDWTTEVCKVTAAPGGTAFIALYGIYDLTHSLQVYAPVFNYIPPNTISANEVYAYAAALTPYDQACVVGTVCGITGHVACTNGELALSGGWGSTAAVSGAAGIGQTCEWTITSNGTGTGVNPTITDTPTNPLPTATTVCDMRMVGGTGTATLINQTTVSATAPVFTFGGTPAGSSTTYIVVRRCGP